MSDESAFLAAVHADPDDATARLVYADWLDENPLPGKSCPECENGNCEEREVHEADIVCPRCHGTRSLPDRSRAVLAALHRCIATDGATDRKWELVAACETAGDPNRAAYLRSLLRGDSEGANHLLNILGMTWRVGTPCETCNGRTVLGGVTVGEEMHWPVCKACGGHGSHGTISRDRRVTFRWGFPHTVYATMEEGVTQEPVPCTRCGQIDGNTRGGGCARCEGDVRYRAAPSPWLRAVLAHHPGVQQVVLTGREPYQFDITAYGSKPRPAVFRFGWHRHSKFASGDGSNDLVPDPIFDHMTKVGTDTDDDRFFASITEATDALARAVAIWGRIA